MEAHGGQRPGRRRQDRSGDRDDRPEEDRGSHVGTRQIGEAEAAATQAKGVAEGNAIKAKLLAEAEAIRARAEALATNQEAVIGQTLAEKWPAIVEAASKAFNNVDQMIVLNGADGVTDILGKIMAQGATGLTVARTLLANAATKAAASSANGTAHAPELDPSEPSERR